MGADVPPQLRSQSTDKRLSAAMTAKRKGRDNIFAEKINVDEPWQPKNFPKSPKTRKLLEDIMKSHYNLHALFQSLSDNLIKLTIDAMEDVMGGGISARASVLDTLAQRATSSCPAMSLSECDLQSLRRASGLRFNAGANAMCAEQCSTTTAIASTAACLAPSLYPPEDGEPNT